MIALAGSVEVIAEALAYLFMFCAGASLGLLSARFLDRREEL